jgi:ABC-type Mn2+/Zn2+ transport system ATPase subunit
LSSSERPIVRARDLTVAYGATIALSGVSFEIPRRSSVAVLGPNGSGKSTLFSAITRLIDPVSGSIEVAASSVAYLTQHLDIEPTFPVTVTDVVGMGRWGRRGWLRRLDATDRDAVGAAIAELGLTDLAGRRLHELSGGQRQRALVAQVMAQDAELLLLDEPRAGVDRPTAGTISRLVGRWRDEGRTVMVATHDLEWAAREFDLVLALNRRMVAFGPPDVACTEEVLRETFSGHVARVGHDVVDTSHHHHHAG